MIRLGDKIELTAEGVLDALIEGKLDVDVAGIEEHFGTLAAWAELCASDGVLYTGSTI